MPSPLFRAHAIHKSFAGVHALKDVSFDLVPGEVHALIGENGAGKSTLIRIISGAETPDSGTLEIGGRHIPHIDPATARRLGVVVIHQHPALFPDLTVAENIALTLERPGMWRRLDWTIRNRRAAELLARVGAAIAPERLVETLTMPEQQLVEIAKAIGADAKVVIMDEPSASLTERETARLFDAIARLRDSGAGIVYISHRLEEVVAIADRVTVLRDGQTVATRARDELTKAELIRLMVGRELAAVFPKRSVEPGDVVMELRGLTCRRAGVSDVSLAVRKGEIVGVAGLVGSGRTQLAETIFGITPADAGTIALRGSTVRITAPSDAIALGIGYVPEDRPRHGVVLDMPVSANATLANLRAVAPRGLIDWARSANRRGVRAAARHQDPSISAPARSLSGGNQQKVAVARWLSIDPAVLILDEPTQGVDIGAKAEIHALMQDMVERGMAILMISSELPEVLGMSDRIVVMRQGRINGILPRSEATQERILELALHDVMERPA